MKKGFKMTLVTIATLTASIVGLISVGFSSWIISFSDQSQSYGSITAESIIDLSGFEITSVTSFDFGVYSFENTADYVTTVDITFTLTLTPFNFDTAVAQALSNNGSMIVYGELNSSFGIFTKTGLEFDKLESVKYNSSNVVNTGSNANNYAFSFTLSGVTVSDVNESYTETRTITFTFNNKLLAKDYGEGKTILDNIFTLYLSKEVFVV